MRIKSFSIIVAFAAATGATAAAPPRALDGLPGAPAGEIVLAQSVKERPLDAVPPVDTGRAPPSTDRTGPPPPPAVPPAPRSSTRAAPPPAADDDPPSREMPPPPTSTSRYAPPPPARAQEPAPRPAPRIDEPPPAASAPRRPPSYEEPTPARRADTPRRPPATRSAFAANCTQQCHLSCEASFEACNGDSSPAKPACVKKLESCRVERCACRLD